VSTYVNRGTICIDVPGKKCVVLYDTQLLIGSFFFDSIYYKPRSYYFSPLTLQIKLRGSLWFARVLTRAQNKVWV